MVKTVRYFLQEAIPTWTSWLPPQAHRQNEEDVHGDTGPGESGDLSRSRTDTGDLESNPEVVSKIVIQIHVD